MIYSIQNQKVTKTPTMKKRQKITIFERMISSFLEQYTHTQYTIVISLLKKTDFDLIAVGGLDVGSRNPDESELPELSDRSASGSTSRTLELCP